MSRLAPAERVNEKNASMSRKFCSEKTKGALVAP